jgi:neutral ceramidase
MNCRLPMLRAVATLLAAAGPLMVMVTSASAAEGLRVAVGVAKVDITPETPVRMYGYAARKTESEGVAGRLMAKAMAIGDDRGPGPAVLLTVDSGAVPRAIGQQVFERVAAKHPVRRERFVLCNSHNHSGPNLKGMASIGGAEHQRLAQYASQLTDRLEAVVLEALASRRPAHLAWTQGSVGFAANRRVLKDGKWVGFGAVADAPVDHGLPVLRATAEDGALLAVVVNYACHNTTLRGDFKQIHGDWAGCAQKAIEASHLGAVALVTIGCGADADPFPHGSVALCEKHGQALAAEVSRLMSEATWRPLPATLAAREVVLKIPYGEPPPRDEAAEAARGSSPVARLPEQRESSEQPKSETYQIVTWTFGDSLAMVFLSNEVVVDYARRLKHELDGSRLWICAYTNDVSHYIVSKRLLAEGGYEVSNSLSSLVTSGHPDQLTPAMEDRIVEAVKSLLPANFQPTPR